MRSVSVGPVRQEWEEGFRRLQQERDDHRRYGQLLQQVEVVQAELRRRVGGAFTLAELAGAYGDSEAWSREAVEAQAAAPGWPRTLSLVTAAAFYLYSRGAIDYTP